MAMKIAITGASGLIGSRLASQLENLGHQIYSMTRSRERHGIYWNYQAQEINLAALEGIDIVIHLAGENIAARRWTKTFKNEIYSSRIQGTKFLVESIARLRQPPKKFICASALGIYGNRGDEILTEESQAGEGFLAKVCIDWEKEAAQVSKFGSTCIHARIGIVLSRHGGALKKMLFPFLLGLGGSLGSGQQWMPWIDMDDLISAFVFLCLHETATGPYNLCSAKAIQMKDFSQTLASILRRPNFVQVPEFILKFGMGEMAEALLLASTRARPKKLSDEGFHFKFLDLEASLKHQLD